MTMQLIDEDTQWPDALEDPVRAAEDDQHQIELPATVGELRALLSELPDSMRIYDDTSEPPLVTLVFEHGHCQCVEISR